MSRLCVVHVCLSLDVGGLERIIVGLARSGTARGHRVRIVCLERRGDLADSAEAQGIAVTMLGKRPGLRPAIAAQLMRRLRDDRPDIVHTHQIGALLYAGPAAYRAGVPVVVHTEHGNHLPLRLHGWSRARALGLWSAASLWTDRFACVSSEIATTVMARGGVPRRKVIVLANGTDTAPSVTEEEVRELRRELGLPAGTPVIGTVGRLAEVKRQDLLIEAFVRLRRDRPDARLLIVGDGPERERLERIARITESADAVVFAGQRARPEPFYRLISVFALTSQAEGMPVALLEAWAAGLPVVCTAVGGLPDLITPGQTGWLVPPGDATAFAGALREALEDCPRAAQIGLAGQELVRRRYSTERMAERYEDLYDSLLARETTSCAS